MKARIIGNGMLAKAFSKLELPKKTLVICSGVSNSQEKSISEFDREVKLVTDLSLLYKNVITIYFSSVMVDIVDSPYYKHKSKMEKLIKCSFNNYLILRLPQVVGLSSNNTLFPFFVRSIYSGKKLVIQKEATRALIDVDDVVRITNIILSKKNTCKTISICPSHAIGAFDLAQLIADELNIKMHQQTIEGGFAQVCDTTDLDFLMKDDEIFCDTYINSVIKKYAKKIVDILE